MRKIKKVYILLFLSIIFALVMNYIPNKRNSYNENSNFIVNPHEVTGTDVLRVAVPIDERPLNPFYSDSSEVSSVTRLLHSSLIYKDENNNVVTDLAKDYWYEDRGKTIAVILRDDIKFPSGKSLDANDIKRTFEILADPSYEGKYSSYVDNIEGHYLYKLNKTDDLAGIEVLGNNYLKFKFDVVDFSNINSLTFPIIEVSEDDYKYGDMSNLKGYEFIDGLGSYKVTSRQGNKAILELEEGNDDIKVKKIEFTFLDETQAINKYKNGQIDMVYGFANNAKIFADIDERTMQYSYTINHQSGYYYFLGFNQDSKLFSMAEYRRSLRDSIDIEKTIEANYPEGMFDFSDIPVFKNSWFNEKKVDYDKEKNLSDLIAQDKEKLSDLFDGDKINLKLIALEDDEFFKNIAEDLKNQIENEYINLEISYLSSQDMYKALNGDLEFDLFVSQRLLDDIPNQVLQDRYPIEKEYNINTQAKESFYYILQMIKENKDDEDIQIMTRQWKENFYITAPYIVLATENTSNIINNRVKNIYINEFVGIDYIENLRKIELIQD